MTELEFKELVNLYLDREISESGLADLKVELAANSERKAEFQERCRLHQAMRLAMNPRSAGRRSKSKRSSRSAHSRSKRGSRSASSASSSRSNVGAGQPSDIGVAGVARARANAASRSSRSARLNDQRPSTRSTRRRAEMPPETKGEVVAEGHIPRWIMGTGIAASFVIGLTLLMPVFRDTTHFASQPALEGVEADELLEEDPLDSIGRSELRRFATKQAQRADNQRASIAAQLRLMGLRPEYTPEEKQLRSVSLAAAQRPIPVRNDAELLATVQQISPMPTPQILRVESSQHESTTRWSNGFHSSLASFK